MGKNRKKIIFGLLFSVFLSCFAFYSPFVYSPAVFAIDENSCLTSAKAMVVMEKTSGRVLYEKDSEKRLPMASTTKIVSAIYVIENCDDLDRVVQITKESVGVEGTSIGLKLGEHLTIRELLYGLMLRSGNDSAVALAIAMSGSEKQFVEDVNLFLKEKNILNTRLANPHGLPDENHYTTAYDLAKITAYALSNPVFCEIVSTKEIDVSNELKTKTSRHLINKNKLLKNYEFADGVKTGYTRKAGRCFVGSATKDGMSLVCVLLNCNPMFEECEKLLKKGFNEYKLYKLVSKNDNLGKVAVSKSKTKSLDIYASKDFYYPLKRSELSKIKMKVNLEKNLSAPVKNTQEIANIQISIENQLIFSEKFYTINSIEPNSLESGLKKVIDKM